MLEAAGTRAAHKLNSAAKAAFSIRRKEITSSKTPASSMNNKPLATNSSPKLQAFHYGIRIEKK